MWNLKYGTNELIYKTSGHTDIENRVVVARGMERGTGIGWEFGGSRCKLLHLEWRASKHLHNSKVN